MENEKSIINPFVLTTNEIGAINPFYCVPYENNAPNGTVTCYNDKGRTNIAYEIPRNTMIPVDSCEAGYQSVSVAEAVPAANLNEPLKEYTPFDYARCILAHNHIIFFNSSFFIYYQGCYHEATNQDLYRVIMETCGNFIMKTGNPYLADKIIYALKLFPAIQRDRLDCLQKIIPFTNGFFDLDTMKLLASNPNHFITYCVPIAYDPCAGNCPVFLRFLNTITDGNAALQSRILEIIGYLISQGNDAKKFFLFAGFGDSGKSVLIRLIESLITPDSVFSATMNDFGKPFTPGYMANKHLCTFGDMPRTPISAEAIGLIKSITGNDTIFGAKKYGALHRVQTATKLLFSTNHELRLVYDDTQFMNRCCIVPFMVKIAPEAQDLCLSQKLYGERPAIVNLVIQAYRQLLFRCNGSALVFSGEAEAMQLYNQYVESQRVHILGNDSIYIDFINKCCIFDSFSKIHTEKLYQAYVRYCLKSSYKPDNMVSFSSKFKYTVPFLQGGKWREKGEAPKNGYIGITLKDEYLL